MTEAVTQLAAAGRPIEVRETSRRHTYDRQIRFADIDAHGHVNNARFVEYLEDARIALYLDYAGALQEDRGGLPSVGMVVVRHEVDYRRPLEFGRRSVRIESWVTKVSWASCELAAEIRSDEGVHIEARSTIAAVDQDTAKPRRFTVSERAFLERYLH
ncbi:thioesterase [Amycolatopsis sp. WAC 01375]|uniref:acyl-CoA thioesterase n=1 Tax=unclassified Amycolatopsis TaxID=2618356 RepID=UPI0003846ED8|nr:MULTISPECIES: thioesterase family protein [unclassified Amycolatopsis]AGE12647.1 Dbv30 [Amycolatopsis sp. WAC 01375]QKN67395.1 acyl-CoA thioesterase [Streptomyces coelicolor]RSM68564.1 thioesterase [Amycolatopsis sp. WAC 01375]RSN28350.1 thioesterase [Amycolatopsis sp. WAC 01416]